MTAVYLLNRLPMPILGNKSPFESLFGQLPDYECMRTFGCLAFAFNPENTADKYKARGVPCVFLGYPVSEKGYNFLDLTNHKEFVSQDVYFTENVFPYQTSSSTKYIHPLPITHPIPTPKADYDEIIVDDENSHDIPLISSHSSPLSPPTPVSTPL